ncbi:conserved hypothetical protein [Histoplasma capsulatum var. duboisii H88]|uniref:Uncharacterized protein n=1 Tax=Ajellomyces capsulatus (strain H88) TaxID=544711 RepID=F0UIV5_AJEC8|nr:conserved hypothetical protein [Histoplasma capsulatum var. duboisii H88]QSS56310.1 hypothetical protein I7I53_04488 [Histoplasma capsulatum var. duboisii H88]
MSQTATTASSRRRMNRSSEEAYASPVLRFLSEPPVSLPSPHISQERFRRTRGSSTDEDETEDGILSEDFRAGGPFLCTVPAIGTPLSSDHPLQRQWPELCPKFVEILSKYRIQNSTMDPCLRTSETNEDEGPIETVLICAHRTERDDSWKNTCKDVLSILWSSGFDNVSVELIDERANIEKITSPVMPKDSIYSKWDDISRKICDLLGLEGWLSLECFRRGTSQDPQESHPTVLLTVPRDTTKEWKSKRDEISMLLDNEGLGEVAVEIIRSMIWRATEVDLTSVVLPDHAWETRVKLGASIGVHNSDYGGSTFGGFVELLDSEKNIWRVFGLTCYHAVEPGNVPPNSKLGKDIERWRDIGMSVLESSKANIRIDQPSLKDHNARMKMIKKNIDTVREQSLYKRVKKARNDGDFIIPKEELIFENMEKAIFSALSLKLRAEKHFNTGSATLGRVYAASGFRLTSGNDKRQLDWALISVYQNRVGPNKFPPVGSYIDEHMGTTFSGEAVDDPIGKKPAQNDRLYKFGRRTNFTIGCFSGLKVLKLECWKTGNVIVTNEWSVTGLPGSATFSKRGDSGSFIVDSASNFVGLLFAGNEGARVTYYTPANILFEDIKQMTGARAVRLQRNR